MRKIISNTTPIISLLKVDKLYLLKELYEKVIVPVAVYLEIENDKDKPYYQDLTQIDWIEIQEIRNPDAKAYFLDLDDGEAEVLILAKELNADLVIMDELMERRYSKQLGFNLTGTIGILLKSKENGLIISIKDLLTKLVKKGTWLNSKLVSKVIKLANEK